MAGECAAFDCTGDTPIRCPNGYCASEINACHTEYMCPYSAPILCDDGTCAGRNINTGRSMCALAIPFSVNPSVSPYCPQTAPYKCSDSSCVTHPFYCPMASPCPANYHKCDDGTCSMDVCRNVTETVCPVSRPLRCDDGLCVSSVLQCLEKEGCSSNNECDASVAE